MKLSERLRQKDGEGSHIAAATDPLGAIRERAQAALFARLGPRLYDTSLTEAELRKAVRDELSVVVGAEAIPLSDQEQVRLAAIVFDDILGYGPIEPFLADPSVSEVMVNSDASIFIERDGLLHLTDARFVTQDHLRRVIERIVAQVGRRIDESSPMVDARLPDGSRVNAIIPPLAVDGPALTIRKFSQDPFTAGDLVRMGTIPLEVSEFVDACVQGRLNVLISGGTGTGKTTLLNVMSGFIPEDQRIVTIEDAVELRLNQRHVIRLEARPPNVEGKGEVPIRELVRNALRMRPDRIVVGEVRGGEALDMLQAMNTGHEGSLSTVHANSPRDAISRLETMVLMAGFDLPVKAIREQVASALDLIVQLDRLSDGSRRVTQVSEVVGMEGQVVTLQDVFAFQHAPSGGGELRPTGIRPQFTTQLAAVGIELEAGLFGGYPLEQVG
jgi:pilus assembly protein CpaF